MTRLALFIISLCALINVQGQNKRMDLSELLTDMDCLASIVEKGLENKTWDLENLTNKTDSCENYISARKFELKNDTLIIVRTDNQESSNLIESRLTIENDSLVVARFIPKEPINYSKGKTGKLLTKDELKELSGYISISFIYNGDKIKIDFFSGMKTNQKK